MDTYWDVIRITFVQKTVESLFGLTVYVLPALGAWAVSYRQGYLCFCILFALTVLVGLAGYYYYGKGYLCFCILIALLVLGLVGYYYGKGFYYQERIEWTDLRIWEELIIALFVVFFTVLIIRRLYDIIANWRRNPKSGPNQASEAVSRPNQASEAESRPNWESEAVPGGDYRDILVIHTDSENTRSTLAMYKDHLMNDLGVADVKVDLISEVGVGKSYFVPVENCLDKYRYIFIFLTLDFNEDNLNNFLTDMALMESFNDNTTKGRIIPVYKVEEIKYTCPQKLKPIKEVRYWEFFDKSHKGSYIEKMKNLIETGRGKFLLQ